MAAPNRPPKSKLSFGEFLFLVGFVLTVLAVVGLAYWAEVNPTVRAVLDWPTIPALQALAAHSPPFHRLLSHASWYQWFLLQSCMVVLPWLVALGLYLLFTDDSRRRTAIARRQLNAERENALVAEAKQKLAARKALKSPTIGHPQGGEAAAPAERLKDVFRKRPPE